MVWCCQAGHAGACEVWARLRAPAAGEVIGRLGRLASAQRHPGGLATVARAAAVVRLAEGYDEVAAARLAQAAARQSLERARSVFERLGCPGWARAAPAG